MSPTIPRCVDLTYFPGKSERRARNSGVGHSPWSLPRSPHAVRDGPRRASRRRLGNVPNPTGRAARLNIRTTPPSLFLSVCADFPASVPLWRFPAAMRRPHLAGPAAGPRLARDVRVTVLGDAAASPGRTRAPSAGSRCAHFSTTPSAVAPPLPSASTGKERKSS